MAQEKARGIAESEYGIPDETPGHLPGGPKMTFGEFKKMWPGVILKRPSGGSLAGSVVADVEGWMNNPKSVWEPLKGVAEEEKLNELDMWAPHTAYIRTAPGVYFKADWRQTEKLTGDDAASFIKVAPLQPQVVKSMGLDAKLNNKSALRYSNRELARGGPIGASGPLADREITLVDLTDEQSKRIGVPQLPPGVAAELYKHIEKQGVAEDKEKLSSLDKEIRKELDPQTTELINIARAKYPSAKSDIAAVLKLLQRTKLHSDQEDRQHDSEIADLQQRVDRLEQNK